MNNQKLKKKEKETYCADVVHLRIFSLKVAFISLGPQKEVIIN